MFIARATVLPLVIVAAVVPILANWWLVFFVQPSVLGTDFQLGVERLDWAGLRGVIVYSVIGAVFVSLGVGLLIRLILRTEHMRPLRVAAVVALALGISALTILFPWVAMDFAVSHVEAEATGGLGAIPLGIGGFGLIAAIAGAAMLADSREQ